MDIACCCFSVGHSYKRRASTERCPMRCCIILSGTPAANSSDAPVALNEWSVFFPLMPASLQISFKLPYLPVCFSLLDLLQTRVMLGLSEGCDRPSLGGSLLMCTWHLIPAVGVANTGSTLFSTFSCLLPPGLFFETFSVYTYF